MAGGGISLVGCEVGRGEGAELGLVGAAARGGLSLAGGEVDDGVGNDAVGGRELPSARAAA